MVGEAGKRKLSEQMLSLVLGGARSGKSRFAEELALACGLAPVYLATGQAIDEEMSNRIELHRHRRGPQWRTVEEPLALGHAILRESSTSSVVLIDCLTLWLGNLYHASVNIEDAFDDLVAALGRAQGPVIAVANEIGFGLVPDNAMGRRFRDQAGMLNQRVAAMADHVHLVVAGIATQLKPR